MQRTRSTGLRSTTAVLLAALAVLALSTISASASIRSNRASGHGKSTTLKIQKLSEVIAIHNMLPAKNKKSGFLVFDTVPNPPWANVGSNGQVDTGVDIDLGKALTQVLGLKLRTILVGSAAALLGGISSGRYDTFLGPLGVTQERLTLFDELVWVKNTFFWQVLKGSPIHQVKGLCGTSDGVLSGTISQAITTQVSADDCVANHLPPITEVAFATGSEAQLAIASGRIAAYAEADATCDYALTQPGGQAFRCVVPKSNDFVAVNPAAIAVANTNGKLITAMEAALKVVKQSGVYAEILAKWNISNDGVSGFTLHEASQ